MIYPADSDYNQYEGDWHYDKWHGKGKLITKSSLYEGDFSDGEIQGIGKLTSQNYSYEGEFDHGAFNGQGTYICVNGKQYKG